ncbi:MAG: head-tail connector protein [Firmicutes bacterium]|nr:head-tail connector protein [Bacillota bacterium]
MNKVTLGEVKQYIGLDGEDENKILAVLLSAAEHLVEKVLRKPIRKDTPEIVKTAVLFAVWQLYFHRDNAEFKTGELEKTLAVMLSDVRRIQF